MTPEELDACWRDPRNWKWGVYYCRADPRVIVPKRLKWMGWTVNAARPSAIPVTFLLLAVMVVPVAAFKGAGIGIVLLAGAASIAVVCLLCSHFASSVRWNH